MSLFDKSAETYDEWCSTSLGSFVDTLEKSLIKEVAQPKSGERTIDLGCGTGSYSIWLAKNGLTVTGIDISPEMLKKAEAKALENNKNISFIEGDIHNLPFSDNLFDLAVCNIVLEFVDHPEQVISEGLRVLKRGGRLVAGMIGKQSEWARSYEKRGKENPESVFASARFFSIHDIEQFHKLKPSNIRLGLYFSAAEFVNAEQSASLEEQRSKSQREEGAGFIVARWDKK